MTTTQLQNIIKQGEGISVEFKTSREKLNKDAFESICAFLNRKGLYLSRKNLRKLLKNSGGV